MGAREKVAEAEYQLRATIERLREERGEAGTREWHESEASYRAFRERYDAERRYPLHWPARLRSMTPDCDCSCGGENHGQGHA